MKISTRGRAVFLCVISAAYGFAQGPTTDLQQLRAKLQQLEAMMASLQAEIAAAEQARKIQVPPTSKAPSTPPKMPFAQSPVTYIDQETRERQVVEDDPIDAPRIDNEELDPTLRGYFRLPGTETLVRIRGFVKTDFFYDLNVAGLWFGGLAPSSFPSSPQPKSANSTVSQRPSRLTTEFRQPLGDDVLKGLVEWDLYGAFGRNTLRLRHFWAQYKNFLAGQTNSAFGDPDIFPDTLDFQGAPGTIGIRLPQFRYTHPFNPHHFIGGSVEMSGADTPFSTLYGTPVATSLFPNFVAFYQFQNRYGHIRAATLFRSVGGVIPNTEIPDLKAHRTGYGMSLSGLWRMGRLRDNIVFQGVGGRGISGYYNDNFGLGADVGFDANRRLVATPSWSSTVGYQHYWTRNLRSNAVFGYLRINNTAADPGTSYHVSNYLAGNLIYQPSVLYLFGAEYNYASLRRKDDFAWVAPRIQASLTFFLNRYPVE
jgi:hypothetical protein